MFFLDSSQVTQILRDLLQGKSASVIGADADKLRAGLKEDIALAKKKGWTIQIPEEWEIDIDIGIDNMKESIEDGDNLRIFSNKIEKIRKYTRRKLIREGGEGSGNYGHAGRPGEVGGSGEGGDKDAGFGVRMEGYTATESKRIEEGVPIAVRERRKNLDKEMSIDYTLRSLTGPKRVSSPTDIIKAEDKITFEKRQGKCFETAGRFVMENDSWNLVHATLYPRIGPFEDEIYFHGFAEKGDTVYDAVFDKFYDKNEYYKYYSITDERKYNYKEMIKFMLGKKNWGPWE